MKYIRHLVFAILVTGTWFGAKAQIKTTAVIPDKPKLVIGIVVDQMRWDYLYRYAEKYSESGFKRLLREGYSCSNAHINYMPSYTAPGHTCIYTGSVPAIHGIAGNSWYDYDRKMEVTSVDDTSVTLVGNGKIKGNVSAHNLLVTTVTDELRLATNFQSKVVSLALKDRSAILPGGHHPTGTYFADASTGNFVTSSYYMTELPAWANNFNDKKLAEKYLAQKWNTVLPIEQYTESTNDDEAFEGMYKGETKPVFPHNLAELSKIKPDVLSYSPFGNRITFDFAKAAIEGEKLGKGTVTDFLTMSLSSTDLVGHQFGTNSIEIEDCYLRLDMDLGNFLLYLDEKIGKGNYLVFLTADHGAGHAVGYMNENKIPAGSFDIDSTIKVLNRVLSGKFGEGLWIVSHENMQLYLNRALMEEKKVRRDDLFNEVTLFLMKCEAIANVVDLKNIATASLEPGVKNMLANGYNAKRSGDLQILYNPAWFEGFTKGTTHGTTYAYDTHIPLIWMGWKIKHAEDYESINMTDIAPTIAAMLHIQEPSGSVGKVIKPLLAK